MWVLRLLLLAANAIALVVVLYLLSETYSRTGGLPTPRWAPLSMTLMSILNLIYLWFSIPTAKAGAMVSAGISRRTRYHPDTRRTPPRIPSPAPHPR